VLLPIAVISGAAGDDYPPSVPVIAAVVMISIVMPSIIIPIISAAVVVSGRRRWNKTRPADEDGKQCEK